MADVHPQETGQPEKPRPLFTAIDALVDIQGDIKRLIGHLAAQRADVGELAKQLTGQISRYLIAEERHLYPAVKASGGEQGRLFVAEGEDDINVIRGLLAQLQAESPAAEEWFDVLAHLEQDVKHHFDEEEGDLFPLAQACIDDEVLVKLGDAIVQDEERP